jgi:hypothetical protein
VSEEFIDDVRGLEKLEKFEGGVPEERTKANKIVDRINAIIAAAERAAADNAGGKGLTIFCVFNGGRVPVFIPGAKVQGA